MKAMVFAAGLGTRLQPLTLERPKALIEVAGVAALQRVLERIRRARISDVVVNLHHFPQMIVDFLKQNDNFGLNISFSDESRKLLDTGGGLLKALPLLGDDEPVLLHNADIVTDFPIAEMIDSFNRCPSDAMLLVSERESSRRLLFDGQDCMRGWKNLSTGRLLPESLDSDKNLRALSFGGVHIVSPSLFPSLRQYGETHGDCFSITTFYVNLCSELIIKPFTPSAPYRWHDIGSLEKLNRANREISQS